MGGRGVRETRCRIAGWRAPQDYRTGELCRATGCPAVGLGTLLAPSRLRRPARMVLQLFEHLARAEAEVGKVRVLLPDAIAADIVACGDDPPGGVVSSFERAARNSTASTPTPLGSW